MEARSGGSFRILPEKTQDHGKSEKKIYVIQDLMQSSAYEAALQLEDEDNVRPFLDDCLVQKYHSTPQDGVASFKVVLTKIPQF